jgi:hypothetical protein
MKKLFLPTLIGLVSMTLLTGCLNLQLGGGTSNRQQPPTVGQQLVDLKQAKDSGAITEAEYEAQKARLLSSK